MKRWLVSALASLALAPAAWTFAEHRALIVGVGKHQDASMNLPGIELDTAMMGAAAERLGFPPRSIRTLLDEDATLAAFRREFASLAAACYEADDRVLVYFQRPRHPHTGRQRRRVRQQMPTPRHHSQQQRAGGCLPQRQP